MMGLQLSLTLFDATLTTSWEQIGNRPVWTINDWIEFVATLQVAYRSPFFHWRIYIPNFRDLFRQIHTQKKTPLLMKMGPKRRQYLKSIHILLYRINKLIILNDTFYKCLQILSTTKSQLLFRNMQYILNWLIFHF